MKPTPNPQGIWDWAVTAVVTVGAVLSTMSGQQWIMVITILLGLLQIIRTLLEIRKLSKLPSRKKPRKRAEADTDEGELT